jgi:4-hydroxy-tetrahydrodipicolinate reductase
VVYRIVQWGTGSVGKHALRTIVERPDFELAGLRVYNPEKVGVDAGDILGTGKTGILATDDADVISGIDADCVCYTALGSTLEDREGPLDDICKLLGSGKNVVSSAIDYHIYLARDQQPKGAGKDAYQRITKACAEGGTTYFHSGINPGFTMDVWPILLSNVCRRIDLLKVVEVIDMSRYASSHMVRESLGFGLPPDTPTRFDKQVDQVRESPFYWSMRMLADAIGVQFEDVRASRDVAVTKEALTVGAGTIEAGTVAAMKRRLEGIVHGRVAVLFEWVWRLTDNVAPEWPTGDSRWILRIEGDPTVESEFSMGTTYDAKRAVSLSVATVLLNAVPSVCKASPGILNNLSMPIHGGGYFLP